MKSEGPTAGGHKRYRRAARPQLPKAHQAGGRRGKERGASLRAEQRLAAGGLQGSPDPTKTYLPIATAE